MQIIFQDPYASLNPRMNIAYMMEEPMRVHGLGTASEIRERTGELLEMVGLSPDIAARFPHEFSGGQRQRISIARALALNPVFLVCDEAVSSLDVSIQGQILNLLQKVRSELRLTYMFISHNLSVVRHMSDRIAVMYLGRIVELATEPELFAHSAHPYTCALFESVPKMEPGKKIQPPIREDLPSLFDERPGCLFESRCPRAEKICREEKPAYREIAPGHACACHLAG